jgi:hypothetical protein
MSGSRAHVLSDEGLAKRVLQRCLKGQEPGRPLSELGHPSGFGATRTDHALVFDATRDERSRVFVVAAPLLAQDTVYAGVCGVRIAHNNAALSFSVSASATDARDKISATVGVSRLGWVIVV